MHELAVVLEVAFSSQPQVQAPEAEAIRPLLPQEAAQRRQQPRQFQRNLHHSRRRIHSCYPMKA